MKAKVGHTPSIFIIHFFFEESKIDTILLHIRIYMKKKSIHENFIFK